MAGSATTGHAKVRSFATTEEALAQVDACLRKRATATPDRRAIPGAGGDNRSTMRLQTRRLTITSDHGMRKAQSCAENFVAT